MEYTVEIDIQTARKLTESTLFEVAAIGGAASGAPGGRRLGTTLTVEAADVPQAAERAIAKVMAIVPGDVAAIEILTAAEFDRRSDQQLPEFVGVSEIAAILGVSRQRVSTLSKRDDFPVPVASLASGPVWRASDLSTFQDGWQRQPGRPRETPVKAATRSFSSGSFVHTGARTVGRSKPVVIHASNRRGDAQEADVKRKR